MVTPQVVGHIDPVGWSGLKANGKPDLEAEGVAVAGQGGVRVRVREEARVNGEVHGGQASRGPVTRASRFLTGLVTCLATHDGSPAAAAAACRR